MDTIEIPTSIWLNVVVLAAAGGFIWFKLVMGRASKESKKGKGLPTGSKMRAGH